MRRLIHNLVLDFILFSPALLGGLILDDILRYVYLMNCMFFFLIAEVFFGIIQKGQSIIKGILAVVWLLFWLYMFFDFDVLAGWIYSLAVVWAIDFLFRCLALFKKSEKVNCLLSRLQYLINASITINRYWVPVLMLLMLSTMTCLGNIDAFWYGNDGVVKGNTWIFLGSFLTFLLVFILFKWIRLIGYLKLNQKDFTGAVFFISIYDCLENYRPVGSFFRTITAISTSVQNQFSYKQPGLLEWCKGLTEVHGINDCYYGKIHDMKLQEMADIVPKTCQIIWNSKKVRGLSKRSCEVVKRYIKKVEQYGCTVVIVDTYNGRKVYGDRESFGYYLRTYYPYYYERELQSEMVEAVEERELYRDLFIQIRENVNSWSMDDYQKVKSLLDQLTGNRTSMIRSFYALMKLSEYIIHKEGLLRLSTLTETQLPSGILVPSAGTFASFVSDEKLNEVSNFEEIIESLRYIDGVLVRGNKNQFKESTITYRLLCQRLVSLRNRLIGHGTMVYAVSEGLVFHLSRIVLYMLKRYQQLEIPEQLTWSYGNQMIHLLYGYKKCEYLYNGMSQDGIVSYLNYAEGTTLHIKGEEACIDEMMEISSVQEYLEDTDDTEY